MTYACNLFWSKPTSARQQHRRRARSKLQCQASARPKDCLFVFGLGYTGRAIATSVRKIGWTVVGTCRQPEQQQALAHKEIKVICAAEDEFDLHERNQLLDAMQQATHVLCTIPPSPSDSLAAELVLATAASSAHLQWIGYLSSTSVYGDWGGSWVDERSELRPGSSKALQRAEAEAAWLRLHTHHELPVHVFRLGGIYGPGRSALQAVQQQGQATASQQRRSLQQYTARCHVQDICNVLAASMHQPNPGSIYNVVDEDPAGRAEVMAYAATLLGKQPALDSSSSNSNSSSSNLDSKSEKHDNTVDKLQKGSVPTNSISGQKGEKRVSNGKVKSEFCLTWEFPSYREGLLAIHAGDLRPFG